MHPTSTGIHTEMSDQSTEITSVLVPFKSRSLVLDLNPLPALDEDEGCTSTELTGSKPDHQKGKKNLSSSLLLSLFLSSDLITSGHGCGGEGRKEKVALRLFFGKEKFSLFY